MKPFCILLGILVFVWAPMVRADDESPDDQFVRIYALIKQGDGFLERGKPGPAAEKYAEAQKDLKQIKTLYPEWSPKIVKYRLDYLANKLAQPLLSAPALVIPSEPVEMKLKWEIGKRLTERVDTAVNTEVTMPGQAQAGKQDVKITQEIALTALKDRDGGGKELEMEFLGIAMDMKIGTQRISFDSKKASAAGGANPLAATLGKLVGAKLKYLLDASGKIESIEGMKEFMDRFAEPDTAGLLKGMFTEDNLKQMVPLAQELPDKPVKAGDSWPMSVDLPTGPLGAMVLKTDNTFKGLEKHDNRTCAVIEFSGTMTAKPAGEASPAGMMSLEQGETSGKTWFDPAAGVVVETTSSQDLTMKIKGTADGPSMSTKVHQLSNSKLVQITDAPK